MSQDGPLIRQLTKKLHDAFAPEHLEVINESHLHAGHQPGFDGQGESHIRIRMKAAHFNGKGRVAVHREVNKLCAPEFEAGLHALALDVKGTG